MNTTVGQNKLTRAFNPVLALIPLFLGVLTWAQPASAATLTTDREDYPPFSYVYITGTGFGTGETVRNHVVALSPAPAEYDTWDVVADESGYFTTSWFVFSDELIGTTLEVTATGQSSGLSASAIFGDATPPSGNAPVAPPTGGFAIDGDLRANTPASNVGDWYAGAGGTGGAVLNSDSSGTPIDPNTTFHFVDAWQSSTDDNFAGGDKVDDNPNTWNWTRNPVNDKQDINNALVHLTRNPVNGHLWVVVAADRFSNNGDSYIDFEFLQNSITTTPQNASGVGGFSSAGPNCGRTVNDLLLTLSFTKGGTFAGFFASRWVAGGQPCGFDYVDITASIAAGTVFAAVNTSTVSVPNNTAFGGSSYAANTFGEAAVDLTALFQGFDPCLSIGVKTIFIKTKESQSPTANIVDFISPLLLANPFTIGPSANAGLDQTLCSQSSSSTTNTFNLTGTAQQGANPVATMSWSVVSSSPGAIVNIDAPTSCASCLTLPATVHLGSASGTATATLRLTVTDTGNCPNKTHTDDVVLTVNALPSCSLTGPDGPLCPNSTGNVYSGPSGAGLTYLWSITGNGSIVGSTTSQSVSVTAGSGCNAPFTLTLTVSGGGTCPSTCTKTVNVQDLIPPVITATGTTLTLACNPSATAIDAALGTATATDNCSTPTVTSSDSSVTSTGCTRSKTRTFTATDACGRSASTSRTVTWTEDLTGPSLTCPVAVTVQCASQVPPPDPSTVAATDNCGGPVTIIFVGDVISGQTCPNRYTITRTYKGTDACGNSSTCSQTITVNDTTAPTLTCPAPVTVQCASQIPAPDPSAVAAGDNCGGAVMVTHVSDIISAQTCPNKYTITRTYKGTDICGNSSTCAQIITVNDTTAPVISAAGPVAAIDCPATPVFTPPTATDNCDPTPTVVEVSDVTTPGTCAGSYTRTKTWKAVDACSNESGTVSQTITVQDTTKPTITCPPAVTVQCASDVPPANFAGGSTSDTCSKVTVTHVDDVISDMICANRYKILRTYKATDECGNYQTCTQVITVNDTTPPTVTCPAQDLVIECGDPTKDARIAAWLASASASDNCADMQLANNYSAARFSDLCGDTGEQTVVFTATDACGQTASCSRKIIIQDLTKPTITCPPAVTVQCANDVPPANFAGGSTSDTCSKVTVTHVGDVISDMICANRYKILRTYKATDECGNYQTCTQVITVNDDVPPVISPAGPNATIECPATAVFTPPTATDNCSPAPTVVEVSDITIPGACAGAYSRTKTWKAVDTCDNQSPTVSQTITVIDDKAPIFIGCPPSMTVDCNAVPAPANVTATDTCDPNPTVTFAESNTQDSDRTKCGHYNYTITRTWTARDACGNSATCTQIVTVNDTTAPVLTGQGGPATIECPDPPTFTPPVASDNCDPNPQITSTDSTSQGTCAGSYSVTRTWIATDACGNHSAPVSQTITVIDDQPPTPLGCPSDIIVECNAVPEPARVRGKDLCDPNPKVGMTETSTQNPDPSNCGHYNYTITRIWTITDACNNRATCTQVIKVQDSTNPVLAGQGAATTIECPANPAFTPPTASDSCDPNPTITSEDTTKPGDCAGTYSVTRTWIATDACGNPSAPASQTITVVDTTKPSITCPAPITVKCATAVPRPDIGSVAASDACSAVTVTWEGDGIAEQTCPNRYKVNRTYKATDACGNSATCTQIINVYDDVAPVVSPAGPDATIECPATPVFRPPTATDNCDPAPTIVEVSDVTKSGMCAGSYTRTRTWKAVDACGNESPVVSQTIMVLDTSAPTLSGVPADAIVECDAVPAAALPTASDNCDPNPNISYQQVRTDGNCPQNYTLVRTWTATDCSGNQSSKTQVITVRDTARPNITCPPDKMVACDESTDPSNTGTAIATDNCDANPAISYKDATAMGTCALNKVITRTWTATDACGNYSKCVQKITIVCPQTITVDCTTPNPNGNPDEAGAWVDLPGCSPSPQFFVHGTTTTVTCPNANGPPCIYIVTVLDNCAQTCVPTALLYQCPPEDGGTYQCHADLPKAPGVTWQDNCGNVGTADFAETESNPGSNCRNVITRTWTIIDTHANPPLTAICTQIITVNDTMRPVITCPADKTLACGDLTAPANTGSATASDNCAGNVAITFSDAAAAASCTGKPGIDRTWMATDTCGNFSTCVQHITFVDTTPPTITCPPDKVLACGDSTAPSNTGRATATDNCGGNVTIAYTDAATPANCTGKAGIDRTWKATDTCGNSVTCVQHITFEDKTPPVIACPVDKALACGDSTDPSNTGMATATDNCGSSVTITYTDASTAANCTGKPGVDRTWKATDACGKYSTCVQHITFVDTTPPVIACPADKVLSCGDSTATSNTGRATATDNCGGNVTITYTDVATAPNCTGKAGIDRTWKATDTCGNFSTCVQHITFADTTSPVITCPGDKTLTCGASTDPSNTGSATATDNCGGVVAITYTDTFTPPNCTGKPGIDRTWKATDVCGRYSTCVQHITFVDTTAPVITRCAPDATVQCSSMVPPPNDAAVTAIDNCGGAATVTHDPDVIIPGSCPNKFTVKRTYHATDTCGNHSECVQTITVNDNIPPVLAGCPLATANYQCYSEVPAPPVVTATDNCDGNATVSYNQTQSNPGSSCNNVITRTWLAVDRCGNSAKCMQTITVNDSTGPTINCPKDFYANCGSGRCTTDPAITGIATASDNCLGPLAYGGKNPPTVGKITYQDSGIPDPNSCEWSIFRTWTAVDACGNRSTCVQKISCVPFSQSIITDSSLCSYDLNPATPCRDFRLLFTPYGSGYKLNASNPGQTYYNVFYVGTAGASVVLTITLPYPYVTQGANPVHAYDGVTVSGSNPNFCLTPGNGVPITSAAPLPVTLSSYAVQAPGNFTTVTVAMTVPASGFIYLNMHLDYGLKGTVGLAKGGLSGNDAISQTTLQTVVPDGYNYQFSVNGPAINDTDGVCNMNVFKKNPGVGGRAGMRYTMDGVSDIVATPNAAVTLKDAKGTVLSTDITDEDGWYMLAYKWTGKAATLYVTLAPPGKPVQTQAITLKANGFVEANFDVP